MPRCATSDKKAGMTSHYVTDPAPNSATIAERLLAHSRLCEQIARECWSDETAEKLRQMARDCARAAAEIATLGAPEPRTRH